MSKEEKTTIARETVEKYINKYYKIKYLIEESVQPRFWEAVILLCNDLNADITLYIDDRKKFCVHYSNLMRDPITKYGVSSVTELAEKIAREIRNSERRDINKLEYFLLKKRIRNMEETLETIKKKLGIPS